MKTFSQFVQNKFNIIMFSMLPASLAKFYVHCLGAYYYSHNKELTDLIVTMIKRNGFTTQMIPKIFQGIYNHYYEKMFIGFVRLNKVVKYLHNKVNFVNVGVLKKALARKRGVILVTGHFGGVEYLPGKLTVSGYNVTTLADFATPALEQAVKDKADAWGLKFINTKGNLPLVEMKEALANKRILIVECDEFDSWKRSRRSNKPELFLSEELYPDRTIDILQRYTDAVVVFAVMLRGPSKTYTCLFLPMKNIYYDGGLHRHCLFLLSNFIKTFPDQWYQWEKFGKFMQQ